MRSEDWNQTSPLRGACPVVFPLLFFVLHSFSRPCLPFSFHLQFRLRAARTTLCQVLRFFLLNKVVKSYSLTTRVTSPVRGTSHLTRHTFGRRRRTGSRSSPSTYGDLDVIGSFVECLSGVSEDCQAIHPRTTTTVAGGAGAEAGHPTITWITNIAPLAALS